MRIAIAIEWWDPEGGGAERSTGQIAAALVTRGHAVTVLAGGAPARAERDPIEVSPADEGSLAVETWRGDRKPKSGLDAVRFSGWAADRAFGGDFDASLSVTPIVPATLVEPRAGLNRVAMIRGRAACDGAVSRAWRRLGHLLSPRKHALLRLEARVFRDPRVRRYVAISQYMAAQFGQHYGVGDDSIAVVRNATAADAPTTEERRAVREATRRELSLTDGACVYLFPSFDPHRKGLRPLLDAMAKVVATRGDAVLLLAGAYPATYRRRAEKLGLAPRVRHLGRVADMRGLYCAADVTVLPTFYDPASRVVIESLLAGTPAITTAFDGSADWIEACGDPAAGRVVADPRDVEPLAEAMLALVPLASDRDPFAAVRGAMGMEAHAARLEALLREVGADSPSQVR